MVPCTVEAPLDSEDLAIFNDFADRLRRAATQKKKKSAKRRKPSRVGMAVPLWVSVPYPMQTLGRGYVAWKDAKTVPSQSKLGQGGEIRQPKSATRDAVKALRHPKMRALIDKVARPIDLALPWMPPTLKWWRLADVWHRAESPTKTCCSAAFASRRP